MIIDIYPIKLETNLNKKYIILYKYINDKKGKVPKKVLCLYILLVAE